MVVKSLFVTTVRVYFFIFCVHMPYLSIHTVGRVHSQVQNFGDAVQGNIFKFCIEWMR